MLGERAIGGAGHLRANGLRCTPAAVLTRVQRGVGLFRLLDGEHQLTLEHAQAIERRHPALDRGRLHDDALDFLRAVEHPCQARRAHRGGGVEHQLRILIGLDRHAVTKFPIQYNGTITNTANKIARTKHARKKIAEADRLFDRVFHLFIGVYLMQRPHGRHQLVFV